MCFVLLKFFSFLSNWIYESFFFQALVFSVFIWEGLLNPKNLYLHLSLLLIFVPTFSLCLSFTELVLHCVLVPNEYNVGICVLQFLNVWLADISKCMERPILSLLTWDWTAAFAVFPGHKYLFLSPVLSTVCLSCINTRSFECQELENIFGLFKATCQSRCYFQTYLSYSCAFAPWYAFLKINGLYFLSSFRLREKWSRKYREFPHIPSPHRRT